MSLGFHYTGSFQQPGAAERFISENPLEEVWARVAQLSSSEILERVSNLNKPLSEGDAENIIRSGLDTMIISLDQLGLGSA